MINLGLKHSSNSCIEASTVRQRTQNSLEKWKQGWFHQRITTSTAFMNPHILHKQKKCLFQSAHENRKKEYGIAYRDHSMPEDLLL